MNHANPCLHCGACCAHFRVSFYWSEAQPDLGGEIPPELTEEVNDFISCMRGTNRSKPYCIALQGSIGNNVFCSIYPVRPQACRDFGIHWENGRFQIERSELERCNKARRAWRLPPLGLPAHSPARISVLVQQRPHLRRRMLRRKPAKLSFPPKSSHGAPGRPGI